MYKTSNNFLKRDPEAKHMSVEELQQQIDTYGNAAFSKRIETYTKKILGSNSYFFSKQQQCQALFNKYSPTAFLTYSFADHRCKTLHRLLGSENASAKEKTEALINNPHIAAWYFDARMKAIRKYIHEKLLDFESRKRYHPCTYCN